ncbi:MAG: hypothetical protein CVV24_00150 [Ignavibacteriae bacterium HGW-Ignavibacteriae-3]|nr:MAG: hypothetical protein CVV24_00150 [Ignavibacteriae bacterium HGW-Ignavibacteriae-3]
MLKLPPDPKIRFDSEIFSLINEADIALYRLDGAISLLSENHSLIYILELIEAYSSYRIDGLEISPDYLFRMFLEDNADGTKKIYNYIKSLSIGQKLLRDVSNSSHIIKSIHLELYKELENNRKDVGEFRKTNSLIDPTNSLRSKYAPPAPVEIPGLMTELQHFIASNISYPVIINAALVHAQFELIHPFAAGNGLTGRILSQLHLLWKKRLSSPILQLSNQFYKKRNEYFDHLSDLETNRNLELWIKFFLSRIIQAAGETLSIISKTINLRERDYNIILEKGISSVQAFRFLDLLSRQPIVSLSFVTKELGLNKQTSNILITKFLEINLLEEITGQQRNRLFAYKDYLHIFNIGAQT